MSEGKTSPTVRGNPGTRLETAEGIYTLSAAGVNGGAPVAWICQGTAVSGPSGSQTWVEAWVYDSINYNQPRAGVSQDYNFINIPTPSLSPVDINQYAGSAPAFAAWVRQNYPACNSSPLWCDNHSVRRTTVPPAG